jgi:hypothetical protein
MLVIGHIKPLCDWTISISWNSIATSWIQFQLDELQYDFGQYKKHYQSQPNILALLEIEVNKQNRGSKLKLN